MQYPNFSPINPYYPLQKRNLPETSRSNHSQSYFIQPSHSPFKNSHSRSPYSRISPHKIVQKIYLQNNPQQPIFDRRVSIPSSLNKSVIDQLDNKFSLYQSKLKYKYNDLFSRTQQLRQSYPKYQQQSTTVKQDQRILPGCF